MYVSHRRNLTPMMKQIDCGDMIRGSRPWNSLDALERVKPPSTIDPQPVVDLCKTCTREDCSGDCKERKKAAAVCRQSGIGVSKGMSVEMILRCYDTWKSAGGTYLSLARQLGVSTSTLRYWLRKAGKYEDSKRKHGTHT